MASGRLPRDQRREQLLEHAIETFAVAGYHKTSMSDVATSAGVTKPVVYQHFESKHDLYARVLELIGASMERNFLSSLIEAEGDRERVQAGFQAYVDFALEFPEQFRLFFSDSSRGDEEFASEVRRIEELMAHQVAQLITVPNLTDEDRLVMAYGIIGLAESIGRHRLIIDPNLDGQRVADLMTNLVWSGLRGPVIKEED